MEGNKEVEAVFYAKIGDFTGLSRADRIEEHVQVESRLLNGNKIRVRRTTKDGQDEYTFTAKVKSQEDKENTNVQSSTEYDAPITKEMFETFEKIAEQSMKKTRYYFKNRQITLKLNDQVDPITLDNVGYEVDVFTTNGKPCEWAKIDVELDPLLEHLEQKYPEIKSFKLTVKTMGLPFKPTEKIYPPVATEEQKQFVQQLWKTQFTTQLNPAPTA